MLHECFVAAIQTVGDAIPDFRNVDRTLSFGKHVSTVFRDLAGPNPFRGAKDCLGSSRPVPHPFRGCKPHPTREAAPNRRPVLAQSAAVAPDCTPSPSGAVAPRCSTALGVDPTESRKACAGARCSHCLLCNVAASTASAGRRGLLRASPRPSRRPRQDLVSWISSLQQQPVAGNMTVPRGAQAESRILIIGSVAAVCFGKARSRLLNARNSIAKVHP